MLVRGLRLEDGGIVRIEEAKGRLAKAIQEAAKEHGRPNAFYCGELHRLFNGPAPTLCGRIGRYHLAALWTELGGELWGNVPKYENGAFYV